MAEKAGCIAVDCNIHGPTTKKRMNPRLLPLLLFLLVPIVVYAQQDTSFAVHETPFRKHGVAAGFSFNRSNLHNGAYRTFSPFTLRGVDGEINFPGRMYINSFYTQGISPWLEFTYRPSRSITLSTEFSYSNVDIADRQDFGIYSLRGPRSYLLADIQAVHVLFKDRNFHLFYGLGLYHAHTDLVEDYYSVYSGDMVYHLHERSSVHVLQFPVGIIIGPKRFYLRMSTTMALASYSQGEQDFMWANSTSSAPQRTSYSKFCWAPELAREELFVRQYFQIKFGYAF